MQDPHKMRSSIYRPGFDNHAFESHEPSLSRRHEAPHINRYTQAQFGNHGFDLPLRIPSAVQPSVYEMDHLVTFDVSPKSGVLSHADGIRMLRQMESASGVWTRRVLVSIDQKEVVVTEKASGDELESFPISQIFDPVSSEKNSMPNVFNNLVIFVVQRESWTRLPSTMNIFQCIAVSAHDAVEDIKAACVGKFPRSISQAERHSRDLDDGLYGKANKPRKHESNGTAQPSPGVSVANRVVILNHCFDDIESFVVKIQHSARLLKEGKLRGKSDELSCDSDGEPSLATKREFVDCLQKFKLSLNLTVELKDVLRNPSATELLHSIFAPLELIVNVCKDSDGHPKFVESIVSPLLTADTCSFLETHLRPNELQLLNSLGKSWTVSREAWSGPAPSPYIPKFRDLSSSEGSRSVNSENNRNSQSNGADYDRVVTNGTNGSSPRVNGDGTEHEHFITAQQAFLDELQANRRRVCVVTQPRERKDVRELTVSADEIVEVLDDSRNWWKVRNSRNEFGYAPKTILRPYSGTLTGTPNGTPNNV